MVESRNTATSRHLFVKRSVVLQGLFFSVMVASVTACSQAPKASLEVGNPGGASSDPYATGSEPPSTRTGGFDGTAGTESFNADIKLANLNTQLVVGVDGSLRIPLLIRKDSDQEHYFAIKSGRGNWTVEDRHTDEPVIVGTNITAATSLTFAARPKGICRRRAADPNDCEWTAADDLRLKNYAFDVVSEAFNIILSTTPVNQLPPNVVQQPTLKDKLLEAGIGAVIGGIANGTLFPAPTR